MNYTIENIQKLLIEKKITPSKLVQKIYAELDKFDYLNGFVTKTKNLAIQSAKLLDKISIDQKNILFAIPFVAKDNFATKDILTTASSNILNNFIPPYDAKVIIDLKNKHTILMGKATMDELGMGGTGLTGCNGNVLNPWNREYITGGSSSGSAALVATGLIPFALGTDTGDSIRRPASLCGVVGFKPTYGVISRVGVIPYAPSFDTVGFFTQNVNDCSLIFENLLNYDANDYSMTAHKYSHKNINNDISKYKIAYIKEVYEKMHTELQEKFNLLVNDLQKNGVKVTPVSFDKNLLDVIVAVYYIITCVEAISSQSNLNGICFGNKENGKDWYDSIVKTRTKNLGKIVQSRYIIGQYCSSEQRQEKLFIYAKKIRRLIVNEIAKIFKSYDAIIGLAVNSNTKKISEVNKNSIIFENDIAENFLILANFNGMPSITIPLGFWKGNNMPYGININTNVYDEQKLFNIALAMEKIIGLKDVRIGDKVYD